MSDTDTCTICLDILFPHKACLITRIQPCGHCYHTHCIDSWRNHSNTCPTCREDYDLTEDIDEEGSVRSRNTVTKLVDLPVKHDDFFIDGLSDVETELENALDNDRVARRINMLVSRSNVCILCDNGRGNVISCDACSSSFHYTCLGVNGLEIWVCPICDTEQRFRDRPSTFRRSRNSAITDRVYNQHREDAINTIRSTATTDVIEVPEPMSIEEQQSWESFELAMTDTASKDENSGNNTTSVVNNETRRLKRPSRGRRERRQVSEETLEPSLLSLSRSSDSLVNRVLCEMKENRKTKLSIPKTRPTTQATASSRSSIPIINSNSIPNSIQSSPQSSFESTLVSASESQSSLLEDKATAKMNKAWDTVSTPSNELTYEQKLKLQGIVRSKLRPIYDKGGVIDEDEYTRINKKVSHVLYDCFLKSTNEQDSGFETIADYHINREITELGKVLL